MFARDAAVFEQQNRDGRRNFAPRGGIFLFAGMTLANAAAAPPALSDIQKHLAQRLAPIQELTGAFTIIQQPTPQFMREFHVASKSKASLQQTENQMAYRKTITFAERPTGVFRAEYRVFYRDGRESDHSILAFDQREHWKLWQIPAPEQLGAPLAMIGQNTLPAYLGETGLVRALTGYSMPGVNVRLSMVLANVAGCRVVGESRYAGAPCIEVEAKARNFPAEFRLSLDPAHGFAIRRLITRLPKPTGEGMLEIEKCEVPTLQRAEGADLWVPKTAKRLVYGSTGLHTFTDTLEVDFVRASNTPQLPDQHYTPTLEDGSSVHDVRTGKITIHGTRASKRIVDLVKQRTTEARTEFANGAGISQQAAKPPSTWRDYVTFVLIAVGAISAGVAAWMAWRRWREHVA